MLIADSHEFLELYRGDKDLRMGMEMLKLRPDLSFSTFGPDRLSPNDRARFNLSRVTELGLPDVPERMRIHLLPSWGFRFARRESGGIMSLMPTYTRELRRCNPDVIIENPFSWLTPRSYQTYAVARALKVPIVYYDPGDGISVGTKHRVMALWESLILRNIAALITFNEGGARRFVEKYDYPADRIHVIPKPVDATRFRVARCRRELVRSQLGLEPAHIAVGYLGRLARYKGSAQLLEVAKAALADRSLSELRFVFVGDSLGTGETRADYQLPNSQVTGMIPNGRVPEVLAALDIVVFPDVTNPGGFPTAVAEAMAAGKAIIVGVGPSTRFMPLRDGIDSIFIPPRSPRAILDALRRLATAPGVAGRLGRAVAAVAGATMDYPVVAEKWLSVIEAAWSKDREET